MTYQVTVHDEPDPVEWDRIDRELDEFNAAFAQPIAFRRLGVILRHDDGSVAGGLLGATYWGWLYVQTLWVEEAARGQGWGTKLLAMAEAEAICRGCHKAHLDTMSFQALPFYEKQGYTLWGTLPDFVDGHDRYFLKKNLSAGL
jgi:GNAT superfamily N-acetyltransferase